MHDVVFESTRTMTPDAFAEWVRERDRRDENHYELLHGRVVMTPPAGYPHGEIESKLHVLVATFVSARGQGRVFGSSQGYALPSGDIVEPDMSVVLNERWEAGPRPVDGKFLRIVPDVVFEILSTTTASRDRGEKKGIYERNGVREYWLVDAWAREMVVFQLDGTRFGTERVFGERERASSLVLEGLEIAVVEVMAAA